MDDLEFLNSDLWLKYTHKRYLPLDDIRYRLDQSGHPARHDWTELRHRIHRYRESGAVPFFVKTLEGRFWYFPSDSINKKIHHIESLGNRLYDKIKNHTVKRELLTDTITEEAISSALYEGANSTRAEAMALLQLNRRAKSRDDWMHINNYRALQWTKEHSTLPVTVELILKLHAIITKDTLEGDNANFYGKFRDDAVFIGSHSGTSHEKIPDAMEEVIKLVTGHPRFIHGIVRGILLHYFIAYIHPFFDGNGRTARGMFYFEAIKNNCRFVELLSISADLRERGKRYERSFELVKKYDGDMTYFISTSSFSTEKLF